MHSCFWLRPQSTPTLFLPTFCLWIWGPHSRDLLGVGSCSVDASVSGSRHRVWCHRSGRLDVLPVLCRYPSIRFSFVLHLKYLCSHSPSTQGHFPFHLENFFLFLGCVVCLSWHMWKPEDSFEEFESLLCHVGPGGSDRGPRLISPSVQKPFPASSRPLEHGCPSSVTFLDSSESL